MLENAPKRKGFRRLQAKHKTSSKLPFTGAHFALFSHLPGVFIPFTRSGSRGSQMGCNRIVIIFPRVTSVMLVLG